MGRIPHRFLLRSSLRRYARDDPSATLRGAFANACDDPRGRPLEAPAHSAVSFLVARLAAVTDRNYGKARNGGLESGICAHSAFRPDSENLFRPRSSQIFGTGQASRWAPGFSGGSAR